MTAKFNLLASNDFNPRTHVGCDCGDVGSAVPVRGYFNPRTHVGCDYKQMKINIY